jgi:hypothetical protein
MQTQTTQAKKQTSVAAKAPKKTTAPKTKAPKVVSTGTENGAAVTTLAPVLTKEERRAQAYARAMEKQKRREAKSAERLKKAEERAAALLQKAQERESRLAKARAERALLSEAKRAELLKEREAIRAQKALERAARRAAKPKARNTPKFEVQYASSEGETETVSFTKVMEARKYVQQLMKAGTPFTCKPLAAAPAETQGQETQAQA